MKNLFFLSLLALISLNILNDVYAHVHGKAYMNIVLDNQNLTVNATIAAYNIVGFESQPKTEFENKTIKMATEKLAVTNNWLLIRSGNCVEQKTQVLNPFVIKTSESQHHDFEVSIEFVCEKPQEISEMVIKLAQIYSQIEEIEIQWLMHNKQGLISLHENEQEVRFK